MAKMNYNNFEDALEKGLHDMKVEDLLRKADIAQGKTVEETEGSLSPKQMLTIIEHELKWMGKRDRKIYKTLKLKRKRVDELIKLVNTPKIKLKQKELEEIEALKRNVENLKKKMFPNRSDEELLNQEIGRHVYKRHNVKEEWLPLDTHAHWNKHKKPKGFSQ